MIRTFFAAFVGLIAISLMPIVAFAGAARQSAYSALGGRACTLIDSESEGEGYSCPSRDDRFQIRVENVEGRESLGILRQGQKEEEATNFEGTRFVNSGFVALGEMLEWRGATDDQGKLVPDSLIFRFRDGDGKRPSRLVVLRLLTDNGPAACVIGTVDTSKFEGAKANVEARRISDEPTPCLAQ